MKYRFISILILSLFTSITYASICPDLQTALQSWTTSGGKPFQYGDNKFGFITTRIDVGNTMAFTDKWSIEKGYPDSTEALYASPAVQQGNACLYYPEPTPGYTPYIRVTDTSNCNCGINYKDPIQLDMVAKESQ